MSTNEQGTGNGDQGETALYPHAAEIVFRQPWAILPSTYALICQVMRQRMNGVRLSADEISARIGAGPRGKLKPVTGKVTILPVQGVISHRMNMFSDMSGGTSSEQLGKWFDAAVNDSTVGAIVLDVNSPGGSALGLPELGDKIFAARGSKPIVAVANAEAHSAAYWIACAAERFVVTPSGMVGSIGCLMSHQDYSKAMEQAGVRETLIYAGQFKVEGNSLEPLTDEARAEIQRLVDLYYDQFVAAVARNREQPKSVVRGEKFGQGRSYVANEALARGMVDRVATMDQILTELGVKGGAPIRGRGPDGEIEKAAPMSVDSDGATERRSDEGEEEDSDTDIRRRRARMRDR